jgi:hypothetical protein
MSDDAWKGLAINQLKDIQQTLGRWIERVSQERDPSAPQRLAEFIRGLNEIDHKIKELDGTL